MIPPKIIQEIINYLYQEAKDYAKLGGANESWGLVHGAKKLEKVLIMAEKTNHLTGNLILEITKLEIIPPQKGNKERRKTKKTIEDAENKPGGD